MEMEIADRTKAKYTRKAVNFVWDFYRQTFKKADVKSFSFKNMGVHYMVRLFNNDYYDDEIFADVVFAVKKKKASVILCTGKAEARRDVDF